MSTCNSKVLNIRPLNSALQEMAIKELNEKSEEIQKDLEALREWIKKSPHIKSRDDDQFLVNLLRGAKYRMEATKKKLDLYYTRKTDLPDIARNMDPLDSKVLNVIRKGCVIPLPVESLDGPQYFLVRFGACESPLEDILKVGEMIMDLYNFKNDNLVIAGTVFLYDYTGFTLSHCLRYNLDLLRRFGANGKGSLLRHKASHHFEMPSIFLSVFNFYNSLIPEKQRKRVHVHPEKNTLQKIVPRKILPQEYGGEAGTIDELQQNLEKYLVANIDFFKEEDNYGVDENKREGKSKHSDNLFGIQGSFRQLSID